jgi:DNA polymerase I-like protein with 3'-5' exonuclease and polymerase domains
MVENFRNKNTSYTKIETYFTYAVHCVVTKPSIKTIRCCGDILKEKLVSNSDPDRSVMVFAFGPVVLKTLGFNVKKHADVVGQLLETYIGGRHVYVFASISLAQMVVKSGYIELVNRHIQSFMGSVLLNNEKKILKTKANVGAISKNYIFPKTLQEVSDLVDHIIAYAPEGVDPTKHLIALDTETNTLMPHRDKLKLLTVTVAWDIGKAASITVEHRESMWSLEDVHPFLVKLFTCKKPKVGHNFKFDAKVLRRKKFGVVNLAWDTMIAEHLLAEDKKGFYGLKELVKTYLPSYANYEKEVKAQANAKLIEKKKELKELGQKLSKAEESLLKDDGYAHIPLEDLSIYGAIDADATWQIAVTQRKNMGAESTKFIAERRKLQKFERQEFSKLGAILCPVVEPLARIMATRSLPTLGVLARIENRGVPMDREYTRELAIKMEQSSREAIIKLNRMLPAGYKEKLNPASSGQIRSILYNVGFIHPETKEHMCYLGKVEPPRTDSGAISTNAQFLRLLVTKYDCPFSRDLLEFRAMQKARNTFIENIMVLTREDDRMHTTYHQHGTSSGRLCVSGDTVLDTSQGPFKISKLDLGMSPWIHTHTGKTQQIEGLFYKGKEEMFEVTLESGNFITCTEGHRFLTPKRGFKQLRNLKVGSELKTCNFQRWGVSRIKSIEPVGKKGVWDIQVAIDHSYVAHGFVNHNSSSHENMQNIPKKLGGHNIKKIFVPSQPGYAFGNADAKAAEVRIYSAYSKDKNLIKALNDGMDPHSFFASMVYNPANVLNGVEQHRWKEVSETVGIDTAHGWTYSDFCDRDIIKETEEPYGKQLDRLRGIIKRVVFGILYGATPNKVSSIVGIPEEQAAVIVDTLFKMFPTIPEYIQLTKDQLKHLGFVETFFGRRRRFGELHKLPWSLRSKAERQSVNFKIQSTSSEIVLEVLCDMEEPLRVDMQGELLLTVHDSVGFECPEKYVHQLPEFIKEYGMRRINNRYPWLPVPFSWDVEVGPSYGELMSVDNYIKKMGNVTHIVPENPADRDDFIEQEVRAEFEELVAS